MNELPKLDSIRQRVRTPRAAAIAGILFAVLLVTSQLLIRISIPANPQGPAQDVISRSSTISFALNLLPFAGMAFLWFIAVLRDRLGEREDRFFATVFLGSGLLYIAMIFTSAALASGLIRVLASGTAIPVQFGGYALTRAEIYQIINTYAAKMAGVFMISTSTISLPTRIFPAWMAGLGYMLALLLLLSVGTITWISVVFPLWVCVISVYVLIDTAHGEPGVWRKA
jgi:hypothetical protein